jgi:hypothetical protein
MSEFFHKILNYIERIFMTVAAPCGILLLTFQEFSNLIGYLTIKFAELSLGYLGVSTDFSSVSQIDWTVVNAFIPINQIWSMLLIYGTFMSTILVIRWVKSVFPLISN